MDRLEDRPELYPEENKYSVIKMDEWKPPQDDDFAYKVAEVDSLNEGPHTAAGKGESIIVMDAEGNIVSVTEGPNDNSAIIREELR